MRETSDAIRKMRRAEIRGATGNSIDVDIRYVPQCEAVWRFGTAWDFRWAGSGSERKEKGEQASWDGWHTEKKMWKWVQLINLFVRRGSRLNISNSPNWSYWISEPAADHRYPRVWRGDEREEWGACESGNCDARKGISFAGSAWLLSYYSWVLYQRWRRDWVFASELH